jgi:hypothetical protein
MIAILARGERSVIQVRFFRRSDEHPARVELWLLGRGEPLPLVMLQLERLGLPETYDELLARQQPPEFWLAADELNAVSRRMERAHVRGEPIWIDLDAPRRLTALLPWERLLEPLALGRILRAPQLPLLSVAPQESQRIALCVNLTGGQSLSTLVETALRLSSSLEREPLGVNGRVEVFLHIDSDAVSRVVDFVVRLLRELRLAPGVLHVDHGERGVERAEWEPGPARELGHPWLRWIKQRLAGRGVDRVVMLSEARLFPGRAALALGYRHASGETGLELVRSDELDLFLTQLGAHRLDLHSVRRGWSDLGMRLVADELSWVVPGTVTAHESGDWLPGLAGRLLGGGGAGEPFDGLSPVATCYAAENGPPSWERRPLGELELLDRFTLARDTMRRYLFEGRARGWFAATQRQLERQLGSLARDDCTRTAEPSRLYDDHRRGIEEAMSLTVRAVENYLKEAGEDAAREEAVREDRPPGPAQAMWPA